MTEHETFNADNVRVDTGGGRAGYVVNPDHGHRRRRERRRPPPGPKGNGIGQNGKPVTQAHYDVTNQQWFRDENRYLTPPFVPLQVGRHRPPTPAALDAVDTLVLADTALPARPAGPRASTRAAYYANLKAWVQRGGNLVLTDKAIHALGEHGRRAGRLGQRHQGLPALREHQRLLQPAGGRACGPTPVSSSRPRSSATASATAPRR